MERCKLTVRNYKGLHLRPITMLSNKAMEFQSNITIKMREKNVNAKSVLGLLSACVRYEDEIELICDGVDEKEASEVLSKMIKEGLGDTNIKK